MHCADVQYRVEPREIKARLDSPVVVSVLAKGYSRDLVRQAIERRLTTTGDDFPNAASLTEAIFELQARRNQSSADTPDNSAASAPSVSGTAQAMTVPPQYTSSEFSDQRDLLPKDTKAAASGAASQPSIPADFSGDRTNDEVALEEENRKLKEARTCRVCMDQEISTVFLPCGHLVCCESCAKSLANCPICRNIIRGTVKTFLS